MFVKGKSGNPGGRPKRKLWTEAILKAVETVDPDDKDQRQRLHLLADALVAAGLAGEVQAMKEIGDRIEGKVPQILAGSEDAPLFPSKIELEIVRSQNPSS